MAPVIQKFLVEGGSLVSYDAREKDALLQYLDKNLIVLKEELNDTNFERILAVIWDCSAKSLSDIINISIEVTNLIYHILLIKLKVTSIFSVKSLLCILKHF